MLSIPLVQVMGNPDIIAIIFTAQHIDKRTDDDRFHSKMAIEIKAKII
jgi:hypothetical protein